MSKAFFKTHEHNTSPTFNIPLSQFLEQLNFNQEGLIPAIVQQHNTKNILMMAWMNQDSIRQTLLGKRVCYWSRSRQKLWFKGEESGNAQWLKAMKTDCDGDAILLSVEQHGNACHTDRETCFFWEINDQYARQINTQDE